MIECPKCGSNNWKLLFRCAVDPANDKFQCVACGHRFKRHDRKDTKNGSVREGGG